MEILFENKTIITKEILTEYSKKTYKLCNKKYRAFVLAAFIWSVATSIWLLDSDGVSWYVAFFIFLSIYLYFMFTKAYIINSRRMDRNLKALHGELPEITVRFLEDKLEFTTLQSYSNIEYSKITRFFETKNMYVLLVEQQGIMISKTGFVIGDVDKFKPFITKKCNV